MPHPPIKMSWPWWLKKSPKNSTNNWWPNQTIHEIKIKKQKRSDTKMNPAICPSTHFGPIPYNLRDSRPGVSNIHTGDARMGQCSLGSDSIRPTGHHHINTIGRVNQWQWPTHWHGRMDQRAYHHGSTHFRRASIMQSKMQRWVHPSHGHRHIRR